jgi:TctA family transporter
MFTAALSGLLQVLHPEALLYQLFGLLLGLVFGVIPGLSGVQALAILIPFIFSMDVGVAFSFLLGAHVATIFGGSITAILMNVPGTSLSIATCWDGYPMSQRGEAGRALGVSAMSGIFGSMLGVLILLVSIPFMRPMVLAMQPSEYFMVALMGLTLIVILSAKNKMKGIISGLLGLLVAFIGADPITGVARYTFSSIYLSDGIDLVAVVCGMYAVGEMIKFFVEGGAIAKTEVNTSLKGVLQGCTDVFKHWWLAVRCGVIGALIGACPGVGGTVANVVSYGHAVQSSKTPEMFGTGAPQGIMAADVSNHSKEAPQMIPTLALGIPGGEASAILLGAFLILGLQPGSEMLTIHLDATFVIVWVIALSSVLSSVIGLVMAKYLAKVTQIPGPMLASVIICFGVIGSFANKAAFQSIYVCLIFGVLGYFMRRFNYSEACLIIGLVLGKIFERNFHLSVSMFGYGFPFSRKVSLVLLICTIFLVFLPPFLRKYRQKKEGAISREV